MIKRILLLFALVLGITLTYAQDLNNEKWKSGNQNYSEGNYSQAVRDYESIVESGVENWELYYNLGSAYFKDGDLGRAILNLERAERLNPRDKDIDHNLEVVRAHIVDKIETLPEFFLVEWTVALRNSMSPNGWAMLLIGFVVLSAFFFVRWRLRRGGSDFTLLIVAGSLAVVVLLFAHSAYVVAEAENQAVVLNTSSVVRSSPDANGKELFILHEGTKVELKDKIGNFEEIEIASGNKGWINSGDIEKI